MPEAKCCLQSVSDIRCGKHHASANAASDTTAAGHDYAAAAAAVGCCTFLLMSAYKVETAAPKVARWLNCACGLWHRGTSCR
jgi:hypothetical protein